MSFRVMTYNVHGCIGPRGRDSTREVAEVVAACDPDVVALQELEAPDQNDEEAVHHARDIARPLGMEVLFCKTVPRAGRHYGHALLTKRPVRLIKAAPLPHLGPTEPRGALWAAVSIGDIELQVISTHLGVRRFERAAQSRLLVGPDWLGHEEFKPPGIVCGDLNAIPKIASTYRRIARKLVDANHLAPSPRRLATYPSWFPVFRLDHIFITRDLRVLHAEVPLSHASRRASDHLPFVVDLELAAA